MKYNVNSNGFYGDFGGAYIPEMLFSNIDELKKNYLRIFEKGLRQSHEWGRDVTLKKIQIIY